MPTKSEIRAVKKASEADLISRPGVTGVSIGPKITGGEKTDELSIVVYVEDKRDVPAKQRIPKEIDGIKTDVVQRRFKANAFMPVAEVRPTVDDTRYTELRGGMSIGPCRSIFLEPPDVPEPGNYIFVGTLGALVTDNGTGDHMLLTNFHVAAVDDTWSDGDDMCQPARPDGGSCPGDTVGSLARAVIAGTTTGGAPGVDGAVIRLSGARPTECSIVGIGDVRGTAVATDDMAVRKRGRTTELTFGTVSSTDLTVVVPYGDGIGTITLEDQIEIEVDETQSAAFGISGDSGSVVVNDSERVVGLYFAGNVEETDSAGNIITPEGVIGVANPIAAVESALNVKVCAAPIKKPEFKEFKEFKEFEDKHWLKERIKEYKEYGPKELKERSPKEFKEPKEIFENKRFEDKRFEDKRFEDKRFEDKRFEDKRFEDKYFEGGGPGGRPPGGGFPGGGLPGVEDRLRRLEEILGLVAGAQMAAPSAGAGCIDFAGMPQSPLPNPLSMPGATFNALDHAGNPWPNTGIKTFGTVTGLDTGFTMEIKLDAPCPAIRITLAHFSSAPTVEAFDAAGTSVGSQTVAAAQGTPETITLPTGPVPGDGEVAVVLVRAPQNETLITEFCCLDGGAGPKHPYKEKLEKPEKFEKLEKLETKEKPEKFEKPEKLEIKEKPEKLEIKEKLEKPEKLEKREKPEKFETKEFERKPTWEGKPFETPGGIRPPTAQGGGVEERLARIEAAIGQGQAHFIAPALRPDLSAGALQGEPDAGALGQKMSKDAADTKQSKDLKDSEKPSDG